MSLEQYSKATRETAKNLRVIDDAMFRLVAERKDVCQEILRTLLDKPQLQVVKVTSQSVIASLHREITLDALCILEDGQYVNIEMQKGSGNDDIGRTRFHAAAATAAYTPKGTYFSDIPQVTILYISEYDALQTGQTITYVKRCMKTKEGFVPVDDKEDIFFANTAVKDDTDKSELLQLFLRKDAFEDAKFPKLSKAVKYFKETEGGLGEMCKTVENYAKIYAEDYAKEVRSEERLAAIRTLIQKGFTRDVILSLNYSEAELEAAEKSLLVQV